MKSSVRILLFMCVVAVPFMLAVAQVPITVDTSDVKSQFQVGKSLTQYTDTITASINIGVPSTTTPNVWNFSTLRTHSPQVLTSVPVAGAPHAGDFPGVTHALRGTAQIRIVISGLGTVIADVTLYQFLRLAGDLFNPGNWGSATGTISGIPATGEIKTTNTSSELVFKLPLTINTTWPTTFTTIQVVDVLTPIPYPGAVKDTTRHDARYVVDAFGTMTLPGSGVHQALRLRRVDLIKKKNLPVAPVVSFIFLAKNGAMVNFTGSDTSVTSGTITLGGSTTWNGPLPTDVRVSGSVPTEFALMQNYPNPFNPSTTIAYQVTTGGHVSIRVYNIIGQAVATLVNEVKAPGTYQHEWNAEGIPSGVYFYRMQSGAFTETRRMLLLK